MFDKKILAEFDRFKLNSPYEGDNLSLAKLDEIRKVYGEIANLREEYKKSDTDKTIIGKSIMDRLRYATCLVYSIEAEIANVETKYDDNYKCISDVPRLFKNALSFANSDGKDKYKLKIFYATDKPELVRYTGHPDSYCWIFVISDGNALDKINQNKIYYRDEFSNEIDGLLNARNSVVYATKNAFGVSLNPNYKNDLMKKDYFLSSGEFSNVLYYTFDDQLNEAMEILQRLFKREIEIDKLSYDVLCSRIDDSKKK